MSKVRVAYKQIYRRFFNLSRFDSISYDMICNNVDTFDTIIRKSIHSFRKRIVSTSNVIIQSIYNSSYFSKSSICKVWTPGGGGGGRGTPYIFHIHMCRQNAPLFDDFSLAGHLKYGHLLSICPTNSEASQIIIDQ